MGQDSNPGSQPQSLGFYSTIHSRRGAGGFPDGSIVEKPPAKQMTTCNAGDVGSIPGLGRSPGEENGNPFQYSCLENPRDRGAWRATVHGATESQTRLSDQTATQQGGRSPGQCQRENPRARAGPGFLQTPHRWVSTQGTRPDRRQKQLLGPKSVERAKSQWARSGARIQRRPGNPRQQPHKQDGPGGARQGEGPSEAEHAGRLAEPDRFEEPEASVTLGARKPEHKWAQSHQAQGNSVGEDPGQGPGSSARHPGLGGVLEVPQSNPLTGARSHVNDLSRIWLHASNDTELTPHLSYRQTCGIWSFISSHSFLHPLDHTEQRLENAQIPFCMELRGHTGGDVQNP